MSERTQVIKRPLLALFLCGAALAGCTPKANTEPGPDPYPTLAAAATAYPLGLAGNGLKACFSRPLAEPKKRARDKWEPRLVLEPDPKTGSPAGDPGPLSPAIEKRAKGALVEVQNPA